MDNKNNNIIVIMLSTYNGGKYLPQLLESIKNQYFKNWILFWRDDGSSDNSVAIVEEFCASYELGKCCRLDGYPSRLGALGSFMMLLQHAPDTSANFAFCDQDDIWLPQKLERAMTLINNAKTNNPLLYCSRLKVVNEDLHEIGDTKYPKKLMSIANALSQNIVSGCTIVMNGAARKLVTSTLPPEKTMHDWWCYIVVTAVGGQVIFDNEPSILYRQHATNVVGIPKTLTVRLIRAYERGASEFLDLLLKHLKSLDDINQYFTKESKHIIKKTNAIFVGNTLARLYNIFNAGLYRQSIIETIGLYIWLSSTIFWRHSMPTHKEEGGGALRK
jgi:glycosyltransferase involved in cell wall biosynthesis